MNSVRPILFRLEASPQIGMGHLMRGLVLAREVRRLSGAGSLFATTSRGEWAGRIREERFAHIELIGTPWSDADAEATCELIQNMGIGTLVTDYFGVHPDYIQKAQRAGARVFCIDDIGELTNSANVVVNGSLVPSGHEGASPGNTTRFLEGTQYMILDPSFAQAGESHSAPQGTMEVLVTMGGSDPNQLTPMVVRALEQARGEFRVRVVLGPAFTAYQEFKQALVSARREVIVDTDVRQMAGRMASCDLAITAGGVTLYELCAARRPAVVIAQNEEQLAEAHEFSRHGAASNLGLWNRISLREIAESVAALMEDKAARERMAHIGHQLVDGHGVERVAKEVVAS